MRRTVVHEGNTQTTAKGCARQTASQGPLSRLRTIQSDAAAGFLGGNRMWFVEHTCKDGPVKQNFAACTLRIRLTSDSPWRRGGFWARKRHSCSVERAHVPGPSTHTASGIGFPRRRHFLSTRLGRFSQPPTEQLRFDCRHSRGSPHTNNNNSSPLETCSSVAKRRKRSFGCGASSHVVPSGRRGQAGTQRNSLPKGNIRHVVGREGLAAAPAASRNLFLTPPPFRRKKRKKKRAGYFMHRSKYVEPT